MIKRLSLRISRIAIYFVLLSIALIIVAALLLRFFVLPSIDSYKDQIAHYASNTAGQKITIGKINASWDGINPHLDLVNIDIFDSQNRSALNFKHIESNISWLSIPLFEARVSKLIIHSPELIIRREADGKLYMAGIDMSGKSTSPDFPNWLLKQRVVDVLDAKVIWQDDFRHAPALSLDNLSLHLKNSTLQALLGQHEFELAAKPSIGSEPIAISGHFYGRDVSKLAQWHGQLKTALKNTDLTVWKQWFDYPFALQSGFGSANLTLNFAHAEIEKLVANVSLFNITTKLNSTTEAITFKQLSGQLSQELHANQQEFKGENLKILTDKGLDIQKGYVRILNKNTKDQSEFDADINLDEIQLEVLNKLAPYFPLPKPLLKQLSNIVPLGSLKNLKLHWEGNQSKSIAYSINTAFSGLSIQPFEHVPGFTNLTGDLTANQNGGLINVNSQNALLDFKKLLRWPIPVDKLNGEVSWKINPDKTIINTENLQISNAHLTGSINANYIMNGIKGGYLDLHAKFDKVNAKYAYYYYPIILGTGTLHWLDTAILSGRAEDINLTLKGNLADFPFVDKNHQLDKSLGLFKVTAKISDVVLEYGKGWPGIEGLDLNMLFEGNRMELNANKGHIFGNQIISSKVQIPLLDANYPMLNIVSEVQGPVAEGLKFVNKSPVKDITKGFTDNLNTAGSGKLHLELNIPLQDIEAGKYKGIYQITNGTIAADSTTGLPELSQINGNLNFTENNLASTAINAWVYGGPAQFSLSTDKDKVIRVHARGRVTDVALKHVLGVGFADRINGSADWAGDITIKKPFVDVSLRSNLLGLAINLPAPFNKAASEQTVLRLDKKQLSETTNNLSIGYGNLLNAKILLVTEHNGEVAIERGEIGIRTSAELPEQKGLSIRGSLDYIDGDEWHDILNAGTRKNSDVTSSININKAEFNIKALDIFDRRLNAITVSMKPTSDGWKSTLQSKEITGNIQWINTDSGKVIARLKDLILPSPATSERISKPETQTLNPVKKDFTKLAQQYPALDVIADNFEIGQKKLGSLELIAFENKNNWVIQKLKISNEDSTLNADGEWRNWTHNPNTRFDFNWVITHVDKTLLRFGQPDAVKGGSANIVGQLSWAGSPHEFETTGLNGSFKLKVTKGQIVKVQPGVGRLLGLLSLQSLPRRLSLDFRDLFSSGFAYDKISATARVENGIMRSDDFYMSGPAAEVTIKGETNLQKETEKLNIKVVPHVSDSLSLAAFAGGPIVGVAAFIAQKILKDPFNKIGSTEYQIVGTWDNPQEINGEKDITNTATKEPTTNPFN